MIHTPRYGRCLDDFRPGELYAHPWEVTLDDGLLAHFAASFQDATPLYFSRPAARALGFSDRPVSPAVLLNLGLSFSVHDVSEQAIAHLAYLDVRFPEACYAGDTVRAMTEVLGVKPASKGDRGVVHVRTFLVTDGGRVVCRFDRKALIRGGAVEDRPRDACPPLTALPVAPMRPRGLPRELCPAPRLPARPGGFAMFFEDFAVGQTTSHGIGKTVGESEHMQLTALCRNSHPLHFDAVYCRENSFTKQRVVYGGLVLSWVLSLTSRDVAGNALWCTLLDEGAHPSAVTAGDTLYATSRVTAVEELCTPEEGGPDAGLVTFRVVGTRDVPGAALLRDGKALFEPELSKNASERIPEKVVEISRQLLVRKRP